MSDKYSNGKIWTVVIFLFVMLSGLTMQMIGSLVSTFEDVFGVSESLLGLIAPAGSISFMLTVPFGCDNSRDTYVWCGVFAALLRIREK